MPEEWIDPDVNLVGHMTKIKYPGARAVIKLLREAGLRVLHVGSPALDPWRAPGAYFFADLDLLIRESDLGAFRSAMEANGYRMVMDDARALESSIAPEDVVQRMLTKTASPGASYASTALLPRVDLWVSFCTTWRHGCLTLVDLGDWFDPGQSDTIRVMDDTEIERAPIWGLLLWKASELTNVAADGTVTMKEVDNLHLIASQPQVDWDQVLALAKRYEDEYNVRNGRLSGVMEAYARQHGFEPDAPTQTYQDLALGVQYEMRYAFEAVEDYYPGTVSQSFLAGLRTGSGLLPRKIWGYGDPDWAARYKLSGSDDGVAGFASFSIREQIEDYPNCTRGQDFFDQGIVTPVITDAPPNGPLAECTGSLIQQVFAPV